jgi:hypothetical protein
MRASLSVALKVHKLQGRRNGSYIDSACRLGLEGIALSTNSLFIYPGANVDLLARLKTGLIMPASAKFLKKKSFPVFTTEMSVASPASGSQESGDRWLR